VQFGELHLSAAVNFRSANLKDKFVIGSVCRIQPSGIIFCCGIPIQESDGAVSAQPIQNAVGLSAIIASYVIHCCVTSS